MLNKIGPEKDPYGGTPFISADQELNVLLIFVFCQRLGMKM